MKEFKNILEIVREHRSSNSGRMLTVKLKGRAEKEYIVSDIDHIRATATLLPFRETEGEKYSDASILMEIWL